MKKYTDFNQRAKELIKFLIIQILTVPAVILIFKFIEPRNHAGVIAGSLFILVGVYFVYRNWKWYQYYKSPVFLLSCVHLFVIALPLFIVRMANFETPFEEVSILGMSGPVFHQMSEKVFAALMLSTVFEFISCKIKSKSIQSSDF